MGDGHDDDVIGQGILEFSENSLDDLVQGGGLEICVSMIMKVNFGRG